MPRLRLISAVLLAVPSTVLAGCGDDAALGSWEASPVATIPAGSPEPAAPVTAGSPEPAVPVTAGSPEPAAPVTASPSGGTRSTAAIAGDAELCRQAQNAMWQMTRRLITADLADAGTAVAPAEVRSAYAAYGRALTSLAKAGADTEVTAALKTVGAIAAKVAAAADPEAVVTTTENSAAGTRLRSACLAAGVDLDAVPE